MTLFNKILQEKMPSQHPWERTVKYAYANNIKHAHNSILNPSYPCLKKKVPDISRLKFTIIGNMVTEEFNYCTNLVKGLHKYRWKSFDNPVIKGVTSVEWPIVWNDLKIRYGGYAYCLSSQVAVLINDKFLGGEKELKELVETRYTYHLTLDYYKEGVDQFAKFINKSGRPCAYLHISIDDEHVGTLIFMLYADLVPNTCENFLRLCKTTKGGYSGTPIHRIVKDGWVQCGGFGLKAVELDCENFIIPHDRRGVLCMANDGRHVDCSTQFFVLLQPAPWMAHQYVAFGQLIDGESTLKTIESVPTWYESPKSEIIMYQTGILNLECQDIMINKGANEYIQGHIEDLNALGDILYESKMQIHFVPQSGTEAGWFTGQMKELIDKVFLVVDLRQRERLLKIDLEEMSVEAEEGRHNVRETERFIRKKVDIEKQLQKLESQRQSMAVKLPQKSETDNRRPSSARSRVDNRRSMSVASEYENNEFDVEVYEYEPEEREIDHYKHVSLAGSTSLVVKPEKPFYIPLTDVPYPGDVDSTFDFKKLLRGDYCLENDLLVNRQANVNLRHASYASEMLRLEESENASSSTLDSEDEKEIKKYLKLNVDRVSFAGSVVRSIARGFGKVNIFDETRKSELITDEELRRLRVSSAEHKPRETADKKVSIAVSPFDKKDSHKIRRRQTGFLRPEDLERIGTLQKLSSTHSIAEEEESTTTVRKVRIAPSAIATQTGAKPSRRQTGYIKPMIKVSDADVPRQSALSRLYDDFDVTHEEDSYGPTGPTLRDYKPLSEVQRKPMLLTYSPNSRIKSDDSKEKYLRRVPSEQLYEHALSLQHGKRVARKISSDYVKTMDQMQNRGENSIRSVEFARMRPCLSVSEYQLKNRKFHESNKRSNKILTVLAPSPSFSKKKSSSAL